MIARYRDGVVPEAEPPAELAAEFDGLAGDGRGAPRPRRGQRRARRDLAAGARAQPLRAGRGAVEARQGRRRRRSDLDQVLYGARRGPARGRRCCCIPWMPESAERLLGALGSEDRSLGQRALRRRARRRARSASSASSSRRSRRPSPRPPDDRPAAWSTPTATSTPASRPTRSSSSARAAAGVTRIATVGHARRVDPSARWRRRSEHEEVVAIVGRHPHDSEGFGDGRPRGDRAGRRRPARARDRRDRARLLPRPRPARRPAARVRGPARPGRRGSGCRWSSTPARPRRTPSRCSPSAPPTLTVILHCFSAPDRLDECVERGYLCSFAGNVTYPKAERPAGRGPAACPTSCCWWRPTRPTSPAAGARQAQRARQRDPHRARSWPSCAASRYEELDARRRARTPRRVFGW